MSWSGFRLSLLLGWRSFVRHKRRSIITSLAIAFSLSLMIVFVGLATDAHARMAEIGIRAGAGNVLVQGAGYQEQQSLAQLVDDPQAVVEAARELPHVSGTAVRLFASGLITAGELSSAVVLSGVQPDVEPKVSSIAADKSRVAGDFLRQRADMEFTKGPADIYLGNKLASNLAVDVGDRVVLTVSPLGSSEPASAAFNVRGIFRTGIDDLDGAHAEIPLTEAQQLLGVGERATQVAVLLDDLDASDAEAAALASSLGPGSGLEVLSWKTALRELYEAIVLDDMGMYLMMAIIFVIVAIGIFNMVLMSVAERTREMGVMMAIGTSAGRLFSVVMAEAVVLALVAATVGVLLGLAGHGALAHYGLDLAEVAGDVEMAGIVISGKVYSRLTAADVVTWTGTVIALVLVSAVVPALRVMRLEPVEAMRHV